MATYTYTNCRYSSYEHSVTPTVSSTALADLINILEEGVYASDVSSYITTMASSSSVSDSMTTFTTYVLPEAFFTEDVSDVIEALEDSYTLSLLVDILNAMLFATDQSSAIDSFESGYYETASMTISADCNFLTRFDTSLGLGMNFALNAETDTDVSVKLEYTVSPIYSVIGTTSDRWSILGNRQLYPAISTVRRNYSKTYAGLSWKKGYNRNVLFETNPLTLSDLGYSSASQFEADNNATFKTWLLSSSGYYSSINSIKFAGFGFHQTDANYTNCVTQVTITFSTKLTFIYQPDFSGKLLTTPTITTYTCYDFATICGTEGCSLEQTVDTLSDSVEDLDGSVTDIQEELTLDGTVFTDSSYYESGWTYYSADNPPRVYKYGKVVTFTGIFTNTTTKSTSDGALQVMTLPSAYRPSQAMYALCQGSSYNRWIMTVSANGAVWLDRYGVSSSVSMSANRWLPFTITYVIN